MVLGLQRSPGAHRETTRPQAFLVTNLVRLGPRQVWEQVVAEWPCDLLWGQLALCRQNGLSTLMPFLAAQDFRAMDSRGGRELPGVLT